MTNNNLKHRMQLQKKWLICRTAQHTKPLLGGHGTLQVMHNRAVQHNSTKPVLQTWQANQSWASVSSLIEASGRRPDASKGCLLHQIKSK